ncbi:MAG: hypothetical protein G8D28_05660 [gamma proteobacterium symbiont of Phacoides pectinatus]
MPRPPGGWTLDNLSAGGSFVVDHRSWQNVPKQTASLLAGYRFANGYRLSSALYYTDKMTYSGDGDTVPYAHRWDLKLSKALSLERAEGEISLILQNIGNDDLDFRIYTNDIHNRWEPRAFLQLGLTWN